MSRFHPLFLAFFALPLLTAAFNKGFNLGANLPSTGACKTQADWANDFTTLQGLPGTFSQARLYAASDCATLANAVPAAIAVGTTLLVGVWTEDATHYAAEKQALLAAVQQYGSAWIIGVSVGSEDLYRKNTDANTLVGQIDDVRGMLAAAGAGAVKVGHVDTWTAWVDPANAAVISACDFVGTDGYPYYQYTAEAGSSDVFWQSVTNVKNTVQNVKAGTPVWVTETGWPVSGNGAYSPAIESVPNAEAYWHSVACTAFQQVDVFWFTLQDYTSSPSFGVVAADFKPLYDLTC